MLNPRVKGLLLIGTVTSLVLAGRERAALADHLLPRATEMKWVSVSDGAVVTLPVTRVIKEINGKDRVAYAYAGSIPGPVIRVRQGSRITVVLENRTDEPTTFHPHGLRVKNTSDGVPDLTQKAIKPGEQYKYDLDFPDAGTFWYHPHVRSWYQQEQGLYGVFVVEPRDPKVVDPIDWEHVLVLDDYLSTAPTTKSATASHAVMGRFGDVMLVNGRSDFQLHARMGEVARLHLVNVANARPFKFAIPGFRMKLVGGEASRPEFQRWVDGVVLGPSERATIDVLFDRVGEFPLVNAKPNGAAKLGTVKVSSTKGGSQATRTLFERLRINWDVIQSLDSLRYLFQRPADKKLILSLDLKTTTTGSTGHAAHGGGAVTAPGTPGSMVHGTGPVSPPTVPGSVVHGAPKVPEIEWDDAMPSMASLTSAQVVWKMIDAATGLSNEKIKWSFKLGDRPIIEIYNDPNSAHPMQHPIHFHGQRFLVLSENGKPNSNLSWEDTVLVKTGSRVRILLEVTNPGQWMAHCHVPEHAAAGMETTIGAGAPAKSVTHH